MAIIYTYPLNKDIKFTDELVGTTEITVNGKTKTATRNFLIEDLQNFLGSNLLILTTFGSTGPSTFDPSTRILNIPEYSPLSGFGNLQQVTLNGATTTLYITASGFKTFAGTNNDYLMADGSTRTGVTSTLQVVTDAGNTTTKSITALSFVKSGGSGVEYLMANGTTTTMPTLAQVTGAGNITTASITALSFIKSGGSPTQFLMANGTTTTMPSLNDVASVNPVTTANITANSFVKSGGQPNEFLMANGTTTVGSSSRPVIPVTINVTALSETNTEYLYLMQNPVILTLPTAIGNTNKYNIKSVSTGSPTIYTSLNQTIDDTPNFIQLPVKYSSVTLISNGANWVII